MTAARRSTSLDRAYDGKHKLINYGSNLTFGVWKQSRKRVGIYGACVRELMLSYDFDAKLSEATLKVVIPRSIMMLLDGVRQSLFAK